MKSVTSCCNATLMRKNLTRFWPIWALYTLIWAYALPINCLMMQQQSWRAASLLQRVQDFARDIPHMLGFGVFMSFSFGILTAMAMFSYLYNNRSAGLFHSLPMRRETLFFTGYLSGLVCLLGPNLLIWLLTLGTEAMCGYVDFYTITLWLLAQSAMCLFFYSFAVFCAMFTGHLLALPAFYGILNFLVTAVAGLLDTLFDSFLYGYVGLSTNLEQIVLWLTPTVQLGSQLRWYHVAATDSYEFFGALTLWVYALAGLVLAALALLVYRKRHVESAGDVVCVGIMRPIFKYGFALCVGLFFGYWLYAVFGLEAPGGLTGSLIIWTVIGYFAAQMLLKKTFRVFKDWKGCVVLAAVVALGITGLRLDVMGFADRVPQPEHVTSVFVHGMGSYPYDSGRDFAVDTEDRELIHKTLALHKALVEEHKKPWPGTYNHVEYIRLAVTYELDDGTRLSRDYGVNVPIGSPLSQVAEDFYCNPALAKLSYELHEIDPQLLLNAEVSSLWSAQNESTTRWELWDHKLSDTPYSSRHDALTALYVAVLEDYEQGNLGKRYFNNLDAQRQNNTYTADLTLYWTDPEYFNGDLASEDARYSYHDAVSITLTPQAENTLYVLEQLGVINQDRTLNLYRNVVDEKEQASLIDLDPNSMPKDLPSAMAIIGGADGPTSITVATGVS